MRIKAIVVLYNGLKWIDKCFDSLTKSSVKVEILAIDNGSTDGTVQKLESTYPDVAIVRNNENLGFGKANNIGLKEALMDGTDYVFLLNQDAWIQRDTIQKLISASENNLDFGIVSPIHLNGSGDKLDYNFKQYITECLNNDIISDIIIHGNPNSQMYEVKYVNAAAWLIKRKVLEQIGGFDPLFSLYGEDNDYIYRMNYHGYKVGVVPGTFIYHDREDRKEDWNPERLYIVELSRLKNITNVSIPSLAQLKKASNRMMVRLAQNELLNRKTSSYLLSQEVLKKLKDNYEQIIIHRNICKKKQPNFIDE
jgi:GT2 family glycosyltransferase